MALKPQDIVVLLKIALWPPRDWTYLWLASNLFMSASEVHAAIRRATKSRLFDPHSLRPIVRNLEEFCVHGLKYVWPAETGEPTRGLPTAYAAPRLAEIIRHDPADIYIWPYAEGTARGTSLTPLFKSVPEAALRDENLYVALGALDALRLGRKREEAVALAILRDMLKKTGQ
jgi:hypothetical protein